MVCGLRVLDARVKPEHDGEGDLLAIRFTQRAFVSGLLSPRLHASAARSLEKPFSLKNRKSATPMMPMTTRPTPIVVSEL